ncbi:MAG: GNAT family N-acetyltransferase [Pseudomonadota bacterium]
MTLRPLVQSDAARIADLCNDFAVSQWLSHVPHPYHISDAEGFLAKLETSGHEARAIVPAGSSTLAGIVGLDKQSDGLHLGYWLGRAFWGRGWMTHATRLTVDAVFETGVERLVSGAFEGNGASLAIQRKLGFRVIGDGSLYCEAMGQARRHIDTQLDRADWEALR